MAQYQTVDLIVGPTTLRVSGADPYRLLFIQGIGIAPVNRNNERAPYQDGTTDTGFTLDVRTLAAGWMIVGATEAAIDGYADTLAEHVRPLDSTPVQWKVTRADGEIRQIDTYLIGELDFPNTVQERMGASQKIGGRFYAPDPIWYDPTPTTVVFTTVLGAQGFQIPLAVPLLMTTGGIIDYTEEIAYEGSHKSYPIIYVTGPATNVIITNESTGDVLDFTGTTIAAGVTYIIDLQSRPKTIIDNNGVNRLGTLVETTSHLATWHLKPAQGSFDGENDIRVVVGSNATAATRILISYYDRYIKL